MKLTLSKSQWEQIGKTAGWTKEAGIMDLMGPNAYEHYTKDAVKDEAPKIISNVIVDGQPLILQGWIGSDAVVVLVYHNNEMIGTYDRMGFDVIKTKDVEKYSPFKDQINILAPKVLDAFNKWYFEKENHTEAYERRNMLQ